MRYEVTICAGYHSAEVEADSEEAAKRQFVQRTRDNLDVEHCEAWLIDDSPEAQVLRAIGIIE